MSAATHGVPPPRAEDYDDPSAEAEALFREARARTRRRRASRLALVGALVAFALVVRSLSGGAQPSSSASPAAGLAVDRAAFAGRGVLAFVSEGRLWVLDGATGRLSALTRPSQQASDPQFSPDGRWLTYSVGSASASGPTATWLAHSDGSAPRPIGVTDGVIGWLADGRLVAGSGLWRVSNEERLTRAGSKPAGLAAWSSDGTRYLFVQGGLPRRPPASSSGVIRFDVSNSLNGRRRTWFESPISFDPQPGFQGAVLQYAVVLPKRRGIVFAEDWGASNSVAADGLELQEITAPQVTPRKLGISVGDTVSLGSDGTFAFTRGPNRYAWMTKSVETCTASDGRCSRVPTPVGALSLDPAFSPNGSTLAFVQAASRDQGNFRQATVRHWYATHSLWILRKGSAKPSELAGTSGAASPIWSADGGSLMFVANDALWLLPSLSGRPVRVAAPLFSPEQWPTYYGEVSWSTQFAWQSPARR